MTTGEDKSGRKMQVNKVKKDKEPSSSTKFEERFCYQSQKTEAKSASNLVEDEKSPAKAYAIRIGQYRIFFIAKSFRYQSSINDFLSLEDQNNQFSHREAS